MFDAMVVKPKLAGYNEKEIEFWIDIDGENDAAELLKHMKRYKMRKKL